MQDDGIFDVDNASQWQNDTDFYYDTILPPLFLKALSEYYFPLLAIVGFIVNIISSILFSRAPNLRTISKSHYLAAMTAADAGCLATALINWSPTININLFLVEGLCQLILCCSYIFHFLSIWFTIAFLTDIYICTCMVGKARKMCTVLRSKFVITALTVLAIVMFLHITWMSGIVEGQCVLLVKYEPSLAVIDSIQMAVTIFIPDVCILVLVALIVRKKVFGVCMAKRRLSSDANGATQCLNTTNDLSRPAPKSPQRRENVNHKQNLKMNCLAVSLVVLHVLIIMPDHVVKLRLHYLQFSDGHQPDLNEYHLQWLLSNIGQLRFVLDFIIFIIVLRDFRIALRSLLASWHSKMMRLLKACFCTDRVRYSDGRIIEESFSLTEEPVSKSTSDYEKHGDVPM
ncbi:uncharacterized protein LOC106171827 [Lingula anatina]|uniref:Uncharacterized protein LOC106171827 n=1 Tax=Lingula anatina TaxID=7574 RepID=A0A1S3JC43_LINAN|nr:uncharacterized protein LOC106171827 [Lingula anatina]|eukprot:XP_013407756.1 uncharacterized protein LOC106171827 [Lingula anatina]